MSKILGAALRRTQSAPPLFSCCLCLCAKMPLVAAVQFNSLGTALFCCKFNFVDTDQFSGEYLVWVLCYCSQTDVLFPHWVGALAHTRDAENAPPISGVKPEMCCDRDIFLKLQNAKNFLAAILFYKIWWKYTVKPQKVPHCTFTDMAPAAKTHLFFKCFFCILR